MMNITKRWSKKERDQQIEHLLAIDDPEELRKALEVEVKLAYKAGMMRLNALDNTVYDGPKKWTDIEGLDGTVEMGSFKLLPDLYAQHKGL